MPVAPPPLWCRNVSGGGTLSPVASHCVVLCHHYIDGWCAEHGIDLETEPDGRPPETLNPWRKHRPQACLLPARLACRWDRAPSSNLAFTGCPVCQCLGETQILVLRFFQGKFRFWQNWCFLTFFLYFFSNFLVLAGIFFFFGKLPHFVFFLSKFC